MPASRSQRTALPRRRRAGKVRAPLSAPDLIDHLRSLEERLLQADCRSTREELALLLDDSFREVGSSGRSLTRDMVLDTLPKETPLRRSLASFNVMLLAPGVALATYRAELHPEGGGPPRHSLRSSIWREANGRWRMVFHQGTVAAMQPPF